jgi:GNAT superfamily N-acetyltransferase
MMNAQIVRESDGAVADQLRASLMAWNESQVGPRNTEHFTLSIRGHDDELLGGLIAEMFWNAAYVSVLWVDEAHRGKGYGTALMQRAEEIARARPCDIVFLATITFQAPLFYEKCGYTRLAHLNAAPKGFDRIWFVKSLVQ